MSHNQQCLQANGPYAARAGTDWLQLALGRVPDIEKLADVCFVLSDAFYAHFGARENFTNIRLLIFENRLTSISRNITRFAAFLLECQRTSQGVLRHRPKTVWQQQCMSIETLVTTLHSSYDSQQQHLASPPGPASSSNQHGSVPLQCRVRSELVVRTDATRPLTPKLACSTSSVGWGARAEARLHGGSRKGRSQIGSHRERESKSVRSGARALREYACDATAKR
eukprot:3042744-Pleurochrysis_carterae.AAC.6